MASYDKIVEALKELKVFGKTNFVMLFGSVSKNQQNKLSDVDICISLSLPAKQRLKIRMKLLASFSDKYDIQIFEDLPLYLQKEVLSGKLIYCKNKNKLVRRAIEIIQEYEDFEPLYNYYISKDKSKVAI
jgi:uncharacterized protein